ncbi:MAG: TetR/AcrR family transcriptional regulator [Alkaliphilus sp.]|nr:TetR/AcrR family transcriptional regulator [Alkaliphilus sp.]
MKDRDRYHHGYLKKTMIEEGIKYIKKHGVENMSLRRLASLCNVSHSAPYKHFKDKSDFIDQIILYVTDKFMDTLNEIYHEYKGTFDIMTELGIGYVNFFANNPNYFNILFFENQVDFGLVFSEDDDDINFFPPFALFKNAAVEFLEYAGIEREEYNDQVLFMWSIVQGLATIFTLKGVEYTDRQRASIRRILGIKQYSTCDEEIDKDGKTKLDIL